MYGSTPRIPLIWRQKKGVFRFAQMPWLVAAAMKVI
jgi:hypothetical protein